MAQYFCDENVAYFVLLVVASSSPEEVRRWLGWQITHQVQHWLRCRSSDDSPGAALVALQDSDDSPGAALVALQELR